MANNQLLLVYSRSENDMKCVACNGTTYPVTEWYLDKATGKRIIHGYMAQCNCTKYERGRSLPHYENTAEAEAAMERAGHVWQGYDEHILA